MKKPFILYHWSPSSRRKQIERQGLRVGKPHVTHTKGWQAKYLCFAASPSLAWGLSACAVNEEGDWDLWMTWSASLQKPIRRIRWEGLEVKEYRTYDNLPKRLIWFVGTRHRDPRKRK
jgi:hypothetical protein